MLDVKCKTHKSPNRHSSHFTRHSPAYIRVLPATCQNRRRLPVFNPPNHLTTNSSYEEYHPKTPFPSIPAAFFTTDEYLHHWGETNYGVFFFNPVSTMVNQDWFTSGSDEMNPAEGSFSFLMHEKPILVPSTMPQTVSRQSLVSCPV